MNRKKVSDRFRLNWSATKKPDPCWNINQVRTGQGGRHSKNLYVNFYETSFDPPRKESEWVHSIRRVNSSKSIVIHGQSWGLLERAVKAALQLLLEQRISSRNVFMGSTAYHKSRFFSTICVLWVIPAEQTVLNFSQAALKIDWATSGKWRNAGLAHRLIAQVHIVANRCRLYAWIDNLERGVGRWCSSILKKMDAFFYNPA